MSLNFVLVSHPYCMFRSPSVTCSDFFRCSRAPNSEGSGPIWPKFELVRVPSSLPASLTKIESKRKALAWRHRFPQNFRHSRASNSEVNGPIRPELELVWDFMPVLVTSKFDEDPIKMKMLTWRQHFPIISIWEYFRHSTVPYSIGSGPI